MTKALPIGARLRKARNRAKMSAESATYALWSALPEQYHISQTTLTRIETGAIREPDRVIVAALTSIYGAKFDDIDPQLGASITTLRACLDEVVTHCTWNSLPVDLAMSA